MPGSVPRSQCWCHIQCSAPSAMLSTQCHAQCRHHAQCCALCHAQRSVLCCSLHAGAVSSAVPDAGAKPGAMPASHPTAMPGSWRCCCARCSAMPTLHMVPCLVPSPAPCSVPGSWCRCRGRCCAQFPVPCSVPGTQPDASSSPSTCPRNSATGSENNPGAAARNAERRQRSRTDWGGGDTAPAPQRLRPGALRVRAACGTPRCGPHGVDPTVRTPRCGTPRLRDTMAWDPTAAAPCPPSPPVPAAPMARGWALGISAPGSARGRRGGEAKC